MSHLRYKYRRRSRGVIAYIAVVAAGSAVGISAALYLVGG